MENINTHLGSYAESFTLSGSVHGSQLVLVTVSCFALQACKRGNADVVRLLLEYGADCNILSKHKNTAMYFAKLSNNLMVCDLIKDHISMWVLTAASNLTQQWKEKIEFTAFLIFS